jgi:hypothetical protein
MQSKKRNASGIDECSTQPQVCNAFYAATFHLPMISVTLRLSVLLGCIVSAGVLFTGCTPPPAVIQKCPEPLWKEYSSFRPYKVKEETARLEALLKAENATSPDSGAMTGPADTTAAPQLSELGIKERLFELSIHHANPDYDFDKIFDYVSFLYQHGGPDSLRYLNWGRVVREHKALMRERDSLDTVISAISEGDKKDSATVENLKNELKAYSKQLDSLNAVITSQQKMITDLQKLDVIMEQQRSKIQ